DSSDKVTVKYLDAAAKVMEARGLQLTSFTGAPEVLIQLTPDKGGEKKPTLAPDPKTRQEVSVIDEQNITSALLKLVEPKAATLYFVTGHGELDATSPSMSVAKTALEGQNFKLSSLSLLKGGASIPADASGVFLVAPRVDL